MRRTKRDGRYGGSALEFALLIPWYLFLFVGVFDWGFYAYDLISVQEAARVAALYTSQSNKPNDLTGACAYALQELRSVSNVGSGITDCTSFPVKVTASQVTGADGHTAAQVVVQYQTQSLIPIPGLVNSQYTFSRVVQMKL